MNMLLIGLNEKHGEHIESFKNSIDVNIVGVCDSNIETAKSISSIFNNCPYYTDPFKALDLCVADSVFICLPHYLHYQIVKKALEKEMHIIKEKPLARTLKEGIDIAQELSRGNNKVMVVSQRRFHPTYEKAKLLLPTIGKTQLVSAKYFLDRPVSGWRKLNKLSGGGVVIDSGYHFIDLMNYFFGPPKSVISRLHTSSSENDHDTEDSATITFVYPNNLMVNLLLSRVVKEKEESMIIYGEKGNIFVDRVSLNTEYFNEQVPVHFTTSKDWNLAFKKQLNHFVNVVEHDTNPMNDIQAALLNSIVIDSCYLSNSSGREISIKYQKGKTSICLP